MFVLAEHCGGGPCPPEDQRSSRRDPQLPPRRAAEGQPYLRISALQSHHELRVVLVTLLGQLKGFLDLQQLLFGSHGRGPAAGPAPRSRARTPATATGSPRAASNRAREPLPISRETRAGARSWPRAGGGAGGRAGRAVARAQWRPLVRNGRGASPFLHNYRVSRVGGEFWDIQIQSVSEHRHVS